MAATAGQFVDSVNSITVVLPQNPILNPDGSYIRSDITNYPAVQDSTDPYPVGINIHPTAGGTFVLRIESYHEVTTAGDAEWWSHRLLTDLGKTGPGELHINDYKWEDAIFSQGNCQIVRGANVCAATYTLDFMCSMPAATLSAGSKVTESIPTTTGTNNDADYTFDSSSLGEHTFVKSIQVSRVPNVVHVPRFIGVRLKPRRGGRQIVFNVQTWVKVATGIGAPTRGYLEKAILDMIQPLTTIKGDLIGQGNTFSDCLLTSWNPSSGENWFSCPIQLAFAQEFEATIVT